MWYFKKESVERKSKSRREKHRKATHCGMRLSNATMCTGPARGIGGPGRRLEPPKYQALICLCPYICVYIYVIMLKYFDVE